MKGYPIGKIVKSGDVNPVAPPGALGVIVNIRNNAFAGCLAAVVVWENDTFAEYIDGDVGYELEPLPFKDESIQKGLFSSDHAITEHIQNGYFSNWCISLKKNLANATPS